MSTIFIVFLESISSEFYIENLVERSLLIAGIVPKVNYCSSTPWIIWLVLLIAPCAMRYSDVR